MKILIIGGTGTISTDVVIYALNKGMSVYMLNRGNIDNPLLKDAVFLKTDIRNIQKVKQLVASLHFDVVVDFLSFNVKELEGTFDFFSDKCNQYIFISSATGYNVFKDPDEVISEQTKLFNPLWKYANEKILCENFLKRESVKKKLNYTIVRPYVTYDINRIPYPIIPPRKYQWTLIKRILEGKPIVVCNDGTAKCTLTHSRDFAVGLVGLFNNPISFNNDFHITSNDAPTMNEIITAIGDALNTIPVIINLPIKHIVNDLPEFKDELIGGKANNMVFNNAKIRDAVKDYNSTILFREGITETINYYLNNNHLHNFDVQWDAKLDRAIFKFLKESDPKSLQLYKLYNINDNNKLEYLICRYRFSFALYNLAKRVLRKFKQYLNF